MKSFRFPLDAVLEARRAQETDARQQLAAAISDQNEAATRCRAAVHQLDSLLEEIAVGSNGRFSAAGRGRYWTMRSAQETICTELRKAELEYARITATKRDLMIAARRSRELLERLKEDRRRVWQKDAARAEEHQLDEFAMTQRHQTSNRDLALC